MPAGCSVYACVSPQRARDGKMEGTGEKRTQTQKRKLEAGRHREETEKGRDRERERQWLGRALKTAIMAHVPFFRRCPQTVSPAGRHIGRCVMLAVGCVPRVCACVMCMCASVVHLCM